MMLKLRNFHICKHNWAHRFKISPLHLAGPVCNRDICDGSEHACQDGGVRQHQEARRDRLQKSAARFDALRLCSVSPLFHLK